MQIGRRRGLQLLGAALASPVLPSVSFAETWPSKPIRVIVPLGAGSTIDIVGRIVLDAMAQQLRSAVAARGPHLIEVMV